MTKKDIYIYIYKYIYKTNKKNHKRNCSYIQLSENGFTLLIKLTKCLSYLEL